MVQLKPKQASGIEYRNTKQIQSLDVTVIHSLQITLSDFTSMLCTLQKKRKAEKLSLLSQKHCKFLQVKRLPQQQKTEQTASRLQATS